MHVNSSLHFDQFISNIQEIVDIELILEFIYMLYFNPHSKWPESRKPTKIGESTKLVLY